MHGKICGKIGSVKTVSLLPQCAEGPTSQPVATLVRHCVVAGTLLSGFLLPGTTKANGIEFPQGQAPKIGETIGASWCMDVAEATESKKKVQALSPEEIDAETRAALARSSDERLQKQVKRAKHKSKGGKLVKDPLKSRVSDPNSIPSNKEIEKMALQSAWRPDKLKDMTYTQFWNLVLERQVESVRYTADRRSVFVKTKASAPGGARVEKVGLPYDPELFDHLIENGYVIYMRVWCYNDGCESRMNT